MTTEYWEKRTFIVKGLLGKIRKLEFSSPIGRDLGFQPYTFAGVQAGSLGFRNVKVQSMLGIEGLGKLAKLGS